MMQRLLALVPARLARHAVPVAIGAIGVLLLLAIAATALLSPGALGVSAARVAQTTDLDDVLAGGLTERDADRDGLSDSLENYVYGTDPESWDSAGLGIPDGWLVQYGFDPLDPLTADARGFAPPPAELPAAYADGYPAEYAPPLSVYYAYAKPAGYQPGVDAPWWRAGEHADPVAPDQTGEGIPTGWILRYGLRLAGFDADRVAAGSAGNLTIRQAFEHDTDPLARDSDNDTLDDWTEIEVTRTDPSAFSTAGVGIADGWLLRYGLNAFDPDVATQDPDRDGLTNFEEFQIPGLHPLDWQTSQTGIPDGWYVRYGLSPFGADVERLIGRASDFEEYRDHVPEGEAELPDITFTVRGAYEYARPDDWNESAKGVWWGGTNPVTLDSDGDALPDPVEIRGWYANVTFDTGPDAQPRVYLATSNPLEADSDGDGLDDLEEYRGATDCGSPGTTVRFPPTDPRNRDTAFSGLSDFEKVCGVIRGDARYEVGPKGNAAGLDPTRADSAGDHIKDGARLDHWHEQATAYRANPRYDFPGSAYKTVFEWTDDYARFAGLTPQQVLAQFRPDGDVDADGLMNVVDPDPSGGLYVEAFADPSESPSKVFFLGGPEIDPAAYRLTEFANPVPRPATDPANPDTDGDGLPDSWETRYGRFDPAANGWNLDPAKADSNGDGVTDDKANSDGDVVTWYAYERRGGSATRTTNTFAFDNGLEFIAGTDPNELSTKGDGVPDGWKAFWGSRISSATYPNLVGARDPTLGSYALERIADIDAAMAESPIAPANDLKGLGGKTTGYVRLLANAPCEGDLTTLLRANERKADDEPCYSANNLDNVAIRGVRVYGESTLTYADESRWRTNPYLADSDGDGAPDAYEAYVSVRPAGGAAYPDPTVDDAARDVDGDGLGVAEECGSVDGVQCGQETFSGALGPLGAGADPHAADTDGDGIQDGIEANAALNPLNPADVITFADATRDDDKDGVPDFEELTGRGSTTFFDVLVRTDPADADSDGDGLLDGQTRILHPNADAALVAAWRARGVAHETLPNGSIAFLGERAFGKSFGLEPDRLDSAIEGIPDGWLAYYSLDPTRPPIDTEPYFANRPAWWTEALHGVWWWGERPGIDPPADADGDGLDDRNGEDPFPGTNRLDRVVDGNLTILDPDDLEAWVKAGGDADGQRLRAQRIGEGAGAPEEAREAALRLFDPATNLLYREARACVEVLGIVAPAIVNKSEAFNVSGRVVLDERASGVCGAGNGALLEGSESARVGVPNRTVLVSVLSPRAELVVGAGFTDANGDFTISANITTDQRYEIPAPGLALLGSVDGVALGRFDPTLLATGNTTAGARNTLVVWVYNTSTTAPPGHPTNVPHKARLLDRNDQVVERTVNATAFAASAPVPITVRASTAISFSAPELVENGAPLQGELLLQDASGAPVVDKRILLRWTGSTSLVEFTNLTTGFDGKVNLTNLGILAGVRTPGAYTLSAEFPSADPNLLPGAGAHTIEVREPTLLTAALDRDSATVGETVSVSGVVATRPVTLPDGSRLASAPVPDAVVTLALGDVEESAKADANGRFTVRAAVPGNVAAGEQTLTVKYAGTATTSAAEAPLTLAIKRTAALVDLTRLEGPRDIEVTLRGRLVDNEGEGFSGPIEVVSDRAGILARGLAKNDGSFVLVVPLQTLELGTQQVRVQFPGDSGHAPAENFTQARITSVTQLVLSAVPDVVVRNETVPVGVQLVDDEGAGVPGQPIAVHWRGVKQEVRVTDASGRVSFLVPTNLSERPSIAALGVEYSPSSASVYQPATAAAEVRVVAGVRLALADASVHRGPVAIGGRITDDENRPLAGSAVTIALDGRTIGEARAARNGSFELLHVLDDTTELGSHRLTARFAGTTTLANVTKAATWHVRSPLTLQLTEVGPLVRGEDAPFAGRLLDDRGVPVDATLTVLLAGVDMGQHRAAGGTLDSEIAVPATIERGEATLRVIVPQSERYEALQRDVPVIVKIRPKVEVELPTLAIRGFAVGGGVTLTDDRGEPLRNTSYAYALGKETDAVVGLTNTDGKGALAGVTPLAGDAVLALTVRGGPDVVATQYSTADMRVVGPATPVGYAALVVVLLVLVAIAAVVVAAIVLRRRQLQEARDILDDAIAELLAGNEYAGTIFLAYRRFTAYLAKHGFVEKASDTPREFSAGVRKALPVGAVPMRALITLFEEARYSDHAIGSTERDRAVESLATVRNELDTILGQRKVSA